MRNTGTTGEGRRKSVDLALQTSVLCVKNITQHGRSSRQYDKGIGVRVGGGCARNDCRSAHAGEKWVFPIPVNNLCSS